MSKDKKVGAYDIFSAAERNDVVLLEQLLLEGVDINERDFDRKGTALHWACGKGNLEAIELLIDFGADVNSQDVRGRTPLHTLIEQRYDKIALWFIQYCNADPFIEDKRKVTPYDLSQNFFKQEIDQAIKNRGLIEEEVEEEVVDNTNNQTQTQKYVREEVVKVHLPSGSYKSIKVDSESVVSSFIDQIVEKVNWPLEYAIYLEVFEVRTRDIGNFRVGERKLSPGEFIIELKNHWPLITEGGRNATENYFYFEARIKLNAPNKVKNTRMG